MSTRPSRSSSQRPAPAGRRRWRATGEAGATEAPARARARARPCMQCRQGAAPTEQRQRGARTAHPSGADSERQLGRSDVRAVDPWVGRTSGRSVDRWVGRSVGRVANHTNICDSPWMVGGAAELAAECLHSSIRIARLAVGASWGPLCTCDVGGHVEADHGRETTAAQITERLLAT